MIHRHSHLPVISSWTINLRGASETLEIADACDSLGVRLYEARENNITVILIDILSISQNSIANWYRCNHLLKIKVRTQTTCDNEYFIKSAYFSSVLSAFESRYGFKIRSFWNSLFLSSRKTDKRKWMGSTEKRA